MIWYISKNVMAISEMAYLNQTEKIIKRFGKLLFKKYSEKIVIFATGHFFQSLYRNIESNRNREVFIQQIVQQSQPELK